MPIRTDIPHPFPKRVEPDGRMLLSPFLLDYHEAPSRCSRIPHHCPTCSAPSETRELQIVLRKLKSNKR